MAILGLSTRATNALDRVGVTTVRQLLDLPVGDVRFMRGVGKKTRDEIIAALDHLAEAVPEAAGRRAAGGSPRARAEDPATLDLDALRRKLLGAAPRLEGRQGGRRSASCSWASPTARRRLAEPGRGLGAAGRDAAADRPGGRGRPRRAGRASRRSRRCGPSCCAPSRRPAGVMALPELADALAAARGTALEAPDDRRRLASALVRLAFETEQGMASPRLHLRRAGRVALLACTPELAEYAERLGRVADAIAGENPLPPPLRVFQRLYEVAQPEFPPELRSRRTTSGSSAWPPPPATAPPSRPGRNSTPGAWTPAAPCTSAWGR